MKYLALLAAPLLLAAGPDAPKPFAAATLNVQQGGTRGTDGVVRGGTFKLVDKIEVPADHQIHDTSIAFEGPGWESDKVAYRLYLDERNVPDIYGKRLPGRILPKIGMGHDDYHTLADWGMDIFQVNQSLGMGGIGVLRGGQVTQLGKSSISASVENPPGAASVEVWNRDFAGEGGPATLHTYYRIEPGSRVTRVSAFAKGNVPEMIAGLTLHPGVTVLRSGKRKIRYIATWGVQSLAKDELGVALFYNDDQAVEGASAPGSLYVRFCDPHFLFYAFAAAWVQEPSAPKNLAGFQRWLDETATALEDQGPVILPDMEHCGG